MIVTHENNMAPGFTVKETRITYFKAKKNAESPVKRTFSRFRVGLACIFSAALLLCCNSEKSRFLEVSQAPQLNWQATAIRTFSFHWNDVEFESRYELYESIDGGQSFQLKVTLPADTTEYNLRVPLFLRAAAQYRLDACNDLGCKTSAEVAASGNLAAAIGYLKASNTGDFDYFGSSLAISSDGTTLAIGAYQEDSDGLTVNAPNGNDLRTDSGAVYVYTSTEGVWSLQAFLKPANAGANDRFGIAVAISADGNTLMVGADRESSSATGVNGTDNDAANQSGAAYVFVRSGSSWSQQAYLKASNTAAFDFFGHAVAISGDGNTVAVGAYGEDSNATGPFNSLPHGAENNDLATDFAGAAYVFRRTGTIWSQEAYIKAFNAEAADEFGRVVALSYAGDLLAVSAYKEASNATGINGNQADNSKVGAGAVYTYRRSGATWSSDAYLKASNTGTSDNFGRSLALSSDGSALVVGAPFEDSAATGINGNQADASAIGAGAVYVFTHNGTWSQQAYLKAQNTEGNDNFGYRLAMSGDGNIIAVAAYNEDSAAVGIGGNSADNTLAGSGAVYIFSRSQGAWSVGSYVKASNTGAGDDFGENAIALSGDGSTLAVGAHLEDSTATGIGGDAANNAGTDTGAVYLY